MTFAFGAETGIIGMIIAAIILGMVTYRREKREQKARAKPQSCAGWLPGMPVWQGRDPLPSRVLRRRP